jgi:hypothetical protein
LEFIIIFLVIIFLFWFNIYAFLDLGGQ